MNLLTIQSLFLFHIFCPLFPLSFFSLSHRQWDQNEKKESTQKLKSLKKLYNTR